MNQFFHDYMDEFVMVYFDELLNFSKEVKNHYNQLQAVLQVLHCNGLYTSPKKFVFSKEEIDFIRMPIGKNGIEMSHEKMKFLQNWSKPRSATEERRFLGLLQFFRQLIPKFAKIATPLIDLTKKGFRVHSWNG